MKAAIFDMDGTVTDSIKDDFLALQKAFHDFGQYISFRDYLEHVGCKGTELVKDLTGLHDNEIETLLKKKEEYFEKLADKNGIHPVKDVIPFLEELKKRNIPMALATGSGKDKLDIVFKKIAIQKYFDVVLTANDTNKGKPNPEIFLNAAKKLNFPPQECVVFEDAILGVKAAKNACMCCIAIENSTNRAWLREADKVITRFKQVSINDLFNND